MTVRDRTGRKRYIAISVSPATGGKGEVSRLIQAAASRSGLRPEAVRLLILDSGLGVVSCSHRDISSISPLLNGQLGRFTVETLLTSGTIRTIKERFRLR